MQNGLGKLEKLNIMKQTIKNDQNKDNKPNTSTHSFDYTKSANWENMPPLAP